MCVSDGKVLEILKKSVDNKISVKAAAWIDFGYKAGPSSCPAAEPVFTNAHRTCVAWPVI